MEHSIDSVKLSQMQKMPYLLRPLYPPGYPWIVPADEGIQIEMNFEYIGDDGW